MVTVPVYQQDQTLRPEYRQGIDVQASPDDFGAAIGRGMQQLGQGVAQVGDAVRSVQDFDDTMNAQDRMNKFKDWQRSAAYGENGFMTLSGKAAVDGFTDYQKQLEQKRKEFGQGLMPGASLKYSEAWQSALRAELEQGIRHQAQQRKQWFNDTANSTLDNLSNDALVKYNNPDQVNKTIDQAKSELHNQAFMNGWDDATLKQRTDAYVSGVRSNIVKRMMQDDPLAAKKYLDDNRDQFSGADQYDLDGKLKGAVQEAQSQKYAADFMAQQQTANGQPGPSNLATSVGSPTFNMIAGFESFRSDTYWDVNHWRTGYGSDTITRADGSVKEVQKGDTVSREDAARDLTRRIGQSQRQIVASVGQDKWNSLSGSAQAAVTSVVYNYGRLPSVVSEAIQTGGPAEVADAIRSLGWDNQGINNRRRATEANAVTGGVPAPAAASGNSVYADAAQAARNTANFYTNMEAYLAGIKDPAVQDATRRRLNLMIDTQQKQQEYQQKAASAELWKYIDQGLTPDQVPLDVRQAAGMSAVSSAWSYSQAAAQRKEAQTDEVLLRDMKLYAAQNPNDFANVDLNNYRNKLSKSDFRAMTDLQTTALSDQRKAAEQGVNITTAFSQAATQLEGVGLTTTGKSGSAQEAMAKRIAMFQNALASDMEAFKRANNDRAPTQAEIQQMINRQLLPIVIKQPGTLWGTNDQQGFMFEAANRPDNSTVDVVVKYTDIPIDLRLGIARDLERELGRKPSEDEVVTRYENFVLNR